ncbi:sulfurtransferase complex subunit TusC [Shewanella youngdeokensis]|uniref:Sulfurtransferase complex subunit TusC n=1 Tax=Shewanella youngdeokensis TaxID=2999068 RepID=A0ABZ0K2P0_9GAMM|nr:sulfurtransferase complex subunit TusC [Shewanella sp. DAU334]
MKQLCIIFRQAPHGNAQGREALDLALLSASFEQEVSLIFTDEGILNLLDNQEPELIGAKDYIATFGALPMYDVDTILVCQQSMQTLAIQASDFKIDVEVCSAAKITHHLSLVDEVLVF